MSYPLPVPQEIGELLTMATDQKLQALAFAAAQAQDIDEAEREYLTTLCQYELTLRQQEPLWRKASRCGRRWWNDNGNEAEKVGLGVAVGLLLGIWLE